MIKLENIQSGHERALGPKLTSQVPHHYHLPFNNIVFISRSCANIDLQRCESVPIQLCAPALEVTCEDVPEEVCETTIKVSHKLYFQI